MPALQSLIMQRLYESDVWAGFEPLAHAELQGWNGDHPSLAKLATLPGEKLVVDVGVWKGQSTINMALAMKNVGIDGCVIAVDTFLGSPEHWSAGLFGRKHGMPDLFWTFMSNVYNAGVKDYVVPVPQTSVTAAQIFQRKLIAPTLVHIDAAHEYEEVLRDAHDYYSILAPGGYLIGDDYDVTWPGVVRAAGEFSAVTTRPLMIEWPKWTIQKPND
ncbi:class I SAM-dependent methyltransferase [Methylobacterium durans]|uniref:class I SAM-dependent methyltransferase n=1 Tax=Methylobacterium durans TaxID=2202825 RepID=UPI002AFF5987|nr:class I SAM-dependent methyltransferase [Methylobacterium durans]MEA1832407.1 class I SAM-dependent methyltransferase [Methylobacterium durans]